MGLSSAVGISEKPKAEEVGEGKEPHREGGGFPKKEIGGFEGFEGFEGLETSRRIREPGHVILLIFRRFLALFAL